MGWLKIMSLFIQPTIYQQILCCDLLKKSKTHSLWLKTWMNFFGKMKNDDIDEQLQIELIFRPQIEIKLVL